MTYCVALRMKRGLVFMSDTRTNAGVDDIAQVKKLTSWEVAGDRVITLLSAGNLATTQAVVSLLDERGKHPDDRNPSILQAPSMFQVATIVGETLREVVKTYARDGQEAKSPFGATLILGGQIHGSDPRLFLIYPAGNFIEASDDSPFFQSGETKYGRPILVRAFDPDMTFENAVKLLLVSFDSTIRANLAVDLPLDLQVYEADSFAITQQQRIEQDDPYFQTISAGWGDALRNAFQSLPDFSFKN
ncbi:peptidase [Parasphingorhabdus sp.]|jgi:putative proteasome-type protease|uniref:peptidase n=1 Tax=Parasphingorhabdus sp. TaxID=2709688 RepID=UPI0030020013